MVPPFSVPPSSVFINGIEKLSGTWSATAYCLTLQGMIGGEMDFWICLFGVVITILHLIIVWKALRGVIKYLMLSKYKDITKPYS